MGSKTSNGSNGGSISLIRENGLILREVSIDESGVGLPYAPENWPNPGDNWTWKVGKRIAITGHFLDRYLYLPTGLSQNEPGSHKKICFSSKLSVEKYIRKRFPSVDVVAFFSSFSWKVPAKKSSFTDGTLKNRPLFLQPLEEKTEGSASDFQAATVSCKAGNENCGSLLEVETLSSSELMPCEICCGEPQFCRTCCCILCCKTVSSIYRSYSYIKCEAVAGESYICGHIAHIDCALQAYMAGTVGGSIGLDAEYYCRRCDARTDLVPHVQRILQTCESIDSHDDIEKVLGVGICILRGSLKSSAKELLNRIEMVFLKLKTGICHDLWKVEDAVSNICTESPLTVMASRSVNVGALDQEEDVASKITEDTPSTAISMEWSMSIPFDSRSEYIRLEEETDRVLRALRKSQEAEYRLAEERLNEQKLHLHDLFQQLDKERTDLAQRAGQDSLLDVVLNRVDQIKREVLKLKRMEIVGGGFGQTPKEILKDYFGLEMKG